MKKLIILDFDGTLVNTAPLITGILNNFRAELLLSKLNETDVIQWISAGARTLIANSLMLPDDLVEIWLKKFREQYQLTRTPKSLVYVWANKFLTYATTTSYRLAICSNKPEVLLDKALVDTETNKFFSVISGSGNKTKINRAQSEY